MTESNRAQYLAAGREYLERTIFTRSVVLARKILRLPEPIASLYVYHSKAIRWVDGDTMEVMADQGLDNYRKIGLRLMAINTPERGKPMWAEATARARELCPDGSDCTIQTFKDRTEKYGRYLADVWNADGEHVNETLVREGFAVAYMVKP